MSDDRTDIASAASISAPKTHPTLEETPSPEAIPEEGATPERVLPEDELLKGLLERFESARWTTSHGQDVVVLDRGDLLEFAQAAKEAGFEMLADVTAVDWFRKRRTRFELSVNLVSLRHRRRLRILVPVPGDDPTVPSLVPVWPGANFPEREVYDMFGIVFEGHPDMTRILMPEDWEGHPLRKDYPVGSVPVQFKESHKVV
ncbi:MAG: hypothetical protein KatS3mg011_0435 [Acidimicrobiia bacterium]|nr:MAG: hypothetical protein KatS3mg011_0435 [Acidimicrobiia bacterium]